jgi:cardiolipin synthase C
VDPFRNLRDVRQWAAMALIALLPWFTACAPLPLQPSRVPTTAISDGHRTALAQLMRHAQGGSNELSGVQVLASGREAFATRAELADAAERTLDLQYYSANTDLSSELLLHRIAAAAARGVRVRILLDDIYPPSRQFALRATALRPDIQVRLFNPFRVGGASELGRIAEFVFDGRRLNRRMHNKLWLTDNAVAIVSSRNLGDEYFDLHEDANFADVELLAAGPVVSAMSRAFDAYWNSDAAVPLEAVVAAEDRPDPQSVRDRLDARAAACAGAPPCSWMTQQGVLSSIGQQQLSLHPAVVQFDHDSPDMAKRPLPSGLQHGWIDDHPGGGRTLHELLVVSPYFIPSADGLRHLLEMRDRGVRVAVLTNSLASTDSAAAHSAYSRHRAALLRAGVALYEIRPLPGTPHLGSHRWAQASPSSLHAKFVVQDRRRLIVGSFNQDPRSRLHNTESWVAVDSPALASDIASLFDEGALPEHSFKVELASDLGSGPLRWSTEEAGNTVSYSVEPMVSLLLRVWRSTLGALIPEHLL